MHDRLYLAVAKRNTEDIFKPVTLAYMPFFANLGLITDLVSAMVIKHPTAEFKIEELNG